MKKYAVLLCCLFPLTLNAADDADAAPATWKGVGELGFTTTSGNSESENLNASLAVTREQLRWKHSASIEAIRAETDDVTSVDRVVVKERSEYTLEEDVYLFGRLRYEDDEFSGYDYQASLTFGVGSRVVQNDRHLLDLSIGLGVRSIKDSETRETEDEGITVGELLYEYRISDSATFTQGLLVESGEENTYSQSETALRTKINGNLAAKLNYLIKRNSDVPADIDKQDEIVTISLVYGF